MTDFTSDEYLLLRVCVRLQMESMRATAIEHSSGDLVTTYFHREAVKAEALYHKLVKEDPYGPGSY